MKRKAKKQTNLTLNPKAVIEACYMFVCVYTKLPYNLFSEINSQRVSNTNNQLKLHVVTS